MNFILQFFCLRWDHDAGHLNAPGPGGIVERCVPKLIPQINIDVEIYAILKGVLLLINGRKMQYILQGRIGLF